MIDLADLFAEFDDEEELQVENPGLCLALFRKNQEYPILCMKYSQLINAKFAGVIDHDNDFYFVYKNEYNFVVGMYPIDFIKKELFDSYQIVTTE